MALVLGHGQVSLGRSCMHLNEARAKSTSRLALSFDREIAQTDTTDLLAS